MFKKLEDVKPEEIRAAADKSEGTCTCTCKSPLEDKDEPSPEATSSGIFTASYFEING